MALLLVALPLGAADLRALADQGYSLIDQAARTPGLLIAQAPDEEARAPRAAPGSRTPHADNSAGQAPDEDDEEDEAAASVPHAARRPGEPHATSGEDAHGNARGRVH